MVEEDAGRSAGVGEGRDTAVHSVAASVDEGIRLLQAYRAISSPVIRAKILTLVATHAQRSLGRVSH